MPDRQRCHMDVINNKKTTGRQRISTRKTALFGLLTAWLLCWDMWSP